MKRTLFVLLTFLSTAAAFAQQALNYIALELDSCSRQLVAEYAANHLPWTDAHIIAHHMTILHHTGLRASLTDTDIAAKDYTLAWALAHEGETYTLVATEVGHSDRAFALHITDTPVPSRNRIKHVTLATHTAAGGSAVDSNYIVDWQLLPEPLVLTGRVTMYYKF